MRVLMTTDAVGGVWQYSLALARGLVEGHGCRVLLVCLGEPALEDAAETLPAEGVEVEVLRGLRLEWMPGGASEARRGLEEVGCLVRSWQADTVHSSQFCFGLLETVVPKVVVGHSDVLSWIAWHRHGGRFGEGESGGEDLGQYRELVAAGLKGASAVVAPSRFMADSLKQIYGCRPTVVYNGLQPDLYSPAKKENVALLAGRLWDEAKGAAVAVRAAAGLPLELRMVGPRVGPSGERAWLPEAPNVSYRGAMSWRETRAEMARARYYLATSSYEPFGLAALEAALCGCALLANDTPFYREVWAEAALYYERGAAAALRRKLAGLLEAPDEARRLASAARARALSLYTADRMAAEYHAIYQGLGAGG